METSVRDDVHKAATWSIVISILMMVAGCLALAVPAIAGVTVTLVIGWAMIFSGILHLGYAFQGDRPSAVVWEILLSILYAIVGVYLLARPVLGLEAISLAMYFVLEGILEFVLAFYLRPLAGSGWLVFDGIVTLVLAAMIASGWPASSTWAVGTLVAISMFFSGVTRLMLSITVRKVTA